MRVCVCREEQVLFCITSFSLFLNNIDLLAFACTCSQVLKFLNSCAFVLLSKSSLTRKTRTVFDCASHFFHDPTFYSNKTYSSHFTKVPFWTICLNVTEEVLDDEVWRFGILSKLGRLQLLSSPNSLCRLLSIFEFKSLTSLEFISLTTLVKPFDAVIPEGVTELSFTHCFAFAQPTNNLTSLAITYYNDVRASFLKTYSKLTSLKASFCTFSEKDDDNLCSFLQSNTKLKTLKLRQSDPFTKGFDVRLFLFKEHAASALVVLHLLFHHATLRFHGIDGPLFSLSDLQVNCGTAYDVCWFAGTVCPNLVSFDLDTPCSVSSVNGTADTDFQSSSVEHLTICSGQSFTLHDLPNLKTLNVQCGYSTRWGVHTWKISHKLENVSSFPANMQHPIQTKKLSLLSATSAKPCSYDLLVNNCQNLEELTLTSFDCDPEYVLQFQYPILKKLQVCIEPDQIFNFQKNIETHTTFPLLEDITVNILIFDDSDDEEEEEEEEDEEKYNFRPSENVDRPADYLGFFLPCIRLFQNIKFIQMNSFVSEETCLHLGTSLEQFISTRNCAHDGAVESILLANKSVMYKKEKA